MEFLQFLVSPLSVLGPIRCSRLPQKLSIFVDLGFVLLLLLVAFAKRAKPRPTCAVTAVHIWFKLLAFNCAYILFLQVLVLGYEMVQAMKEQFDTADYSALYRAVVHGVSWALFSFMVLRFRTNTLRKVPILIRFWWFVSLLLCIYTIFVDIMALLHKTSHINSRMIVNFAEGPALIFLFVASIRGITGIDVDIDPLCMQDPLLSDGAEEEEEERQVERPVPGCETVTPYSSAGLFSIITLGWMDTLLRMGAKRPLEMDDIPKLAKTDRAKTSYKTVISEWEKMKSEDPFRQPNLIIVILQSFKREAAINAIFVLLSTLSTYVGPYLISYFVAYLSGETLFPYEGYLLAFVFLLSKVTETLFTRQWYVRVDVMGMHVKSALTAMVYRKGLRLAVTARHKHTSGEIVNYMAVDVQRIGEFAWYMHDTWILPLQIALAMFNLYRSVGVACIAAFLATILSILLTVPLASLQEKFQDSLMEAKDERMRKTSECLKNMRVLKLQAWDEHFRSILEEMRSVEFQWLRKSLYTQALVTFIFWGSPIFVSAATFGTSIYLGHELTAGSVLSALATFRILQDPLRNFPDLVSNLTQTKVSLDRIAKFLEEEELKNEKTSRIPPGDTINAIEIENGCFTWDPVSSNPTLKDMHLVVQRGMRVAVCGAVGAGKSSFLSCILGEMPQVSGQVCISFDSYLFSLFCFSDFKSDRYMVICNLVLVGMR
jgi:ABC-type siderophore export system fused ATPase/permease subunit